MLVGPVERERCDNRTKCAAKDATERHRQVEGRQPCGLGPVLEQLGMKRDREGEEQHEAERREQPGKARVLRKGDAAAEQDDQQGDAHDAVGQPAAVGEGHGKAQEIQTERYDPQQRHRDDIGRQIRRGRQHQARRDRREQYPMREPTQRDGRATFGRHVRRWTARQQQRA